MSFSQHIVSAMGIVQNQDGLILLVESPNRGWEPPGGQIEHQENIPQALVREIEEETGLHCEINQLSAIHKRLGPDHEIVEFVFEAEVKTGTLEESDESPNLGWYDYDKCVELISHPSQEQKLLDVIHSSNNEMVFTSYQLEPFDIVNKVSL